MKKLFPLLLLLFIPVSHAKPDPSFTWTTLTSPHFLIHYHQGEEALAKRVAVLAEDVHNRLVLRMKSQPGSRTHIVLIDALDNANGWATSISYNLITLYITPPLGEPGFGAHPHDDWMRMLITHEYTHIVQFDILHGVSRALNTIFGNFYYPNMWQPVWLIEGLAVHEETELTGGGRNSSPAADMVLRMAVLEDNFPPISHAANMAEKWPAGEVPYLFGGSFVDFIARKYGREKLADISLAYSERLPFQVGGAAYRAIGSDYPELWEEWKRQLARRYEATTQKVLGDGLSNTRALTPNNFNRGGYKNLAPAISPDGRQIAYSVGNADEHASIHLMNIDGSNDRKLFNNNALSGQSIAWGQDGKGLYYTKTEMVRNTNLYNDIYYYDLERRREIRLTRHLRARDAAPSPDGARLVFVVNRLGRTRLAMLPLKENVIAQEQDIVWLGEDSANQFESPRFSPDGQKIALGVRQPDGCKDIWILDSQGNKIEELMHDRAIDGGAAWSADGRSLYFSSDRSGIFNLYSFELASKQISRISNVLGGAFMPSPGGSEIAFVNYSSLGYDIHALENKPATWKAVGAYRDPYPAMNYADNMVAIEQSSYNPLPTLYPHFWLPYMGSSAYSGTLGGLITFGSDAVQRHSYILSALYGPSKHRTWYDLNYRYDGMYPNMRLVAQDIDMSYAGLLEQQAGFAAQQTYVERTRVLDASLVFPLLELDKQHELSLGYRRNTMGRLTQVPPWAGYDGVIPPQGVLASGRVVYYFNNAEKYGYSISPENGRSLQLGYERFGKKIGSDFDLEKYSFDWHEYIDLPPDHHVMLLRAYAGKSTGDVIAQRAFQLGGDNPGDLTVNITEQNIYLRGYPVNQYRGQKVGLLSMEYRFPVKNLEIGSNNTPFFFKRLHGAVFAEAGNAWDTTFSGRDLKKAVGLEARMDMSLAYRLPITVRLGIAKALDDKRDTTAIINAWFVL
ncbi:MAG: BamA/TamA family outer membrane protein [Gallionella sp.]|nr:BamA/TamA family outer membrane protein [Gallionella sp.]